MFRLCQNVAIWLMALTSSSISYSCIMTHFEWFSDAGQARLRIVSFDSKTQRMLHHETMAYVVFDKPFREFLTQFNQPAPQDPELNYRIRLTMAGQLEVVRPEAAAPGIVSRETYLIATAMPMVNLAAGILANVPDLQKNCWVSAMINPKTPDEITRMVPPIKKEETGNFAIINPFTPAHVINQLRNLHSDVKGDLGELITILSAFSYGYLVKPSKYEGNHGLDGIFLRSDNAFLIISQTKAGDSNPRAPTVMNNELNEKHMSDRLQKMLNSGLAPVIQSANLVLATLRDNPERVFKMSHCLLDKGTAQLLIKAVSVGDFPETGPVKLYNAAQADKVVSVRKKMESFAPDPENQLRLALSAIDLTALPRVEAMRLMMEALGLDDEEKDAIVEIIE